MCSCIYLGNINKKFLSHLVDFCCLFTVRWEGVWVNPLKKENLWQKSFFSYNVEWSSKNLWKMMAADVKANIKQLEIKYLVAYLT